MLWRVRAAVEKRAQLAGVEGQPHRGRRLDERLAVEQQFEAEAATDGETNLGRAIEHVLRWAQTDRLAAFEHAERLEVLGVREQIEGLERDQPQRLQQLRGVAFERVDVARDVGEALRRRLDKRAR